MLQYRITKDRKITVKQTDRIGYEGNFEHNPFFGLDRSTKFDFIFAHTGFSLGDWGIISSLPKFFKKIYPNSSFYYLHPEVNKKLFADEFAAGWWQEVISNPWDIGVYLMGYNPYVDGFLPYDSIPPNKELFSDHHRIWKSKELTHEPLIEQLLRGFGATEEEILSWDTRPKLYYSDEVKEKGDEIINKYVDKEYGCLLTSCRYKHLRNQWKHDNYLLEASKKYQEYPVFYYSNFDYKNTHWNNFFKNQIPFKDLNLSLLEQMYIKQKAKFNVGYQAGITDSIIGGGTDSICLAGYNKNDYLNLGVNIGRKVKYIFPDGSNTVF